MVTIDLAGKQALVTGGAAGIGKPEEVASTILFLCSSLSDYITGIGRRCKRRYVHGVKG